MNNPVHTVPFTAMSHDGSLAIAKQAALEFANVLKANCYDVQVVVSTTSQECLVMWCRTVSSQALHEYINKVQAITDQYKKTSEKGGNINTEC